MGGFLIRGWEIILPGWKLSSPGLAGPRRYLEGQLSPRAGSMSPSQSAITQWGWGFHTVRGDIGPTDLCFRRNGGLLEL